MVCLDVRGYRTRDSISRQATGAPAKTDVQLCAGVDRPMAVGEGSHQGRGVSEQWVSEVMVRDRGRGEG